MNVPKLRFKEYSRGSTSAWVKAPLKEFIDDYKGGASLRPSDFLPSGKFEVIPKKAISSGGKLNLDKSSPTYCTETFFSNNQRSVIDRNYLVTTLRDLVPSGPSIGYIVKIEDDRKYLLAQGVYGIKIKDELDEGFLIQFSNTIKYRELMQTMMVGSTQVHIRNGDFFKLLLDVPYVDEQQKIASFLSRVDQRISLLTKKYELLAQYKKGVMQKIFNQEIRFKGKGGEDFPEWRSHKFNEIYDFYPTNSLSREMLNYEAGDVFNIHYGDIHTKFKTRFELKNEVVPFVNEGALGVKVKPDSYCRPGDLVIADASEDYKDVGKAIEVIDVGNKKITAGLHTYIARDKNLQMALGFGGCLMQSAPVRRQIKFLATGTSVLSISKTNLSKIDLLIPSKSEQTAISDYSAKFDKKIEIIKSQLELTKKYKQGLLQQMFI